MTSPAHHRRAEKAFSRTARLTFPQARNVRALPRTRPEYPFRHLPQPIPLGFPADGFGQSVAN